MRCFGPEAFHNFDWEKLRLHAPEYSQRKNFKFVSALTEEPCTKQATWIRKLATFSVDDTELDYIHSHKIRLRIHEKVLIYRTKGYWFC